MNRRWKILGYRANRWAYDNIHTRSERFIVATTGRQVGKSVTAGLEIDSGMNEPIDEFGAPFVGVLGSTYDKAEISVGAYIEMLTRVFGKNSFRANQNKHELIITDAAAGTIGAKLKWLSAEDAYGVVGYTFSKLIVDEAQAIPDEVFFKIRPTLDVRSARMLIFGTPDVTQAQSWFEGLWLRGQDELDVDYHSFSVASKDTPWMSLETIKDAERSMPENEFKRLYGGEWVKDAGAVFPSADTAIIDHVPLYNPELRYIMAVDFAIHEDFNVVLVGELATRTVIFKDRWNKTEPVVTYERIASIWERFGRPAVYVDASGMGGLAMASELRQRGLRIRPITFTASNKMQLVHQLAGDILHRRIQFPRWDDLLKEFRAYVYDRSPSGKLTAGAAAGYHDDIVMTMVMLDEGFHQRSRSVAPMGHNYLGRRGVTNGGFGRYSPQVTS